MWVEWLILADAAEVFNNKIYVMGGGWDRLTVNVAFPVLQHFAVAMAVAVEANETGKTHEFALDVLSPTGKLLATVEAEFEIEPPAGGGARTQHWHFASSVDISLEGPGAYPVVVHLNRIEVARQVFEVQVAASEDVPS